MTWGVQVRRSRNGRFFRLGRRFHGGISGNGVGLEHAFSLIRPLAGGGASWDGGDFWWWVARHSGYWWTGETRAKRFYTANTKSDVMRGDHIDRHRETWSIP